VAESLDAADFGTLLFDLLTPEEEGVLTSRAGTARTTVYPLKADMLRANPDFS
jgi:hypothetical protein